MLRRQQARQDEERAKGEKFGPNNLDNTPKDAELDLIDLEHTLLFSPIEA